MTEEILIKMILDEPLHQGPRLVYADWLEENNPRADALDRAKFIRYQCGLQNKDDPKNLEGHLLQKHARYWFPVLYDELHRNKENEEGDDQLLLPILNYKLGTNLITWVFRESVGRRSIPNAREVMYGYTKHGFVENLIIDSWENWKQFGPYSVKQFPVTNLDITGIIPLQVQKPELNLAELIRLTPSPSIGDAINTKIEWGLPRKPRIVYLQANPIQCPPELWEYLVPKRNYPDLEEWNKVEIFCRPTPSELRLEISRAAIQWAKDHPELARTRVEINLAILDRILDPKTTAKPRRDFR